MGSDLRERAFALYRPPFKHVGGYIYDSRDEVVADGFSTTEAVVRVRGWGRIGYEENAEALYFTVGDLIAEALTEAWNRRATKET